MVQRSFEPPLAVERDIAEPSPLADFRISRHDDKSILRVATEDGQQLAARVRFVDDGAWILHEASQNAAAMVTHAQRLPDRVREIAAMIRRGARPNVDASQVFYYPENQQFGFLLQFPNHAPLSMQLTQSDIDTIRVKTWAARFGALSNR